MTRAGGGDEGGRGRVRAAVVGGLYEVGGKIYALREQGGFKGFADVAGEQQGGAVGGADAQQAGAVVVVRGGRRFFAVRGKVFKAHAVPVPVCAGKTGVLRGVGRGERGVDARNAHCVQQRGGTAGVVAVVM